MTKRAVSMVLAVLLFLSAVPALAENQASKLLQSLNPDQWPITMWVYTENKGKLNVRNEPKAGSKVLEQVEYGSELTVLGLVANDTNWAIVQHKKGANGIGYVMTRYLADHRPSDTDKVARENEKKKNQEELERQQKSYRTVAEPFMIASRPARASGWVNFRSGPGVNGEFALQCLLPEGYSM